MILAIVGMCGAGKSRVVNYLEQEGFSGVHFGSLTIEEIKRRNLPLTSENEKVIREELRRQHGMGAFAVLSIPTIERLKIRTDKIYIDGLYSWQEYRILRERWGKDLIIVLVYADKCIRYRRLLERKFRPLSREEAEKRDITEIENLDKGGPIAFCDYLLINNGDEALLEKEVQEMLRKERSSPSKITSKKFPLKG